jgi:hypothetical protein
MEPGAQTMYIFFANMESQNVACKGNIFYTECIK